MNIQKTISNLENRGYEVVYIEDKALACKIVIEKIAKDATIGFGGSQTLAQLGIVDYILNNDYKVFNRYEEGLSPDEVYEVERQTLLSDLFISSVNAIAETGELVNIDGKSNRVAAQIFGPKQVFLVVGVNKICKTLDEAIDRAQNYAAPINAQRFKGSLKTGCMDTKTCVKCAGHDTICKTIVITRRAQRLNRTTIFLVNDSLGY